MQDKTVMRVSKPVLHNSRHSSTHHISSWLWVVVHPFQFNVL